MQICRAAEGERDGGAGLRHAIVVVDLVLQVGG